MVPFSSAKCAPPSAFSSSAFSAPLGTIKKARDYNMGTVINLQPSTFSAARLVCRSGSNGQWIQFVKVLSHDYVIPF